MIAELFHRLAEATADRIGSETVARRWRDDSALEGYTVEGLAGHLARGVLTVEAYLDQPSLGSDAELTDAAGYLTTVLASHDPVDSELHRAVRERGTAAAVDGPEALAEEVRAAGRRLRERLDDAALQRPVLVLDDVALTLEEYLKTRLVELVVHLDDLAVSIGETGDDETPQDAYRVVAGVLGQVAASRAGGLATVRSLARRERHPDPVRAL